MLGGRLLISTTPGAVNCASHVGEYAAQKFAARTRCANVLLSPRLQYFAKLKSRLVQLLRLSKAPKSRCTLSFVMLPRDGLVTKSELSYSIPNVRPGLSADAEIIVAERDSAVSIPIQSLTVRQKKDLKKQEGSEADSLEAQNEDIEGVFVVEGGDAFFRPVTIGISSSKYFEVLSGLEEGESVVSGNFKAIRDLKDGQRVEVKKK